MQRTEISEVLTAIFSSNIPEGMGFPQLSNRLKCAKKILIKIKTSSEINSVILHCTHWRLHGPQHGAESCSQLFDFPFPSSNYHGLNIP